METQEIKPNGSLPPQLQEAPTTQSFSYSPSMGELAKALAKAQLNFKPVIKASENPAFVRAGKASKYADLHSLISATMPALAAEGIVIIQSPNVRGKELVMISTMLHSSGEWYRNELTLPAADDRGFTAHSVGKAITYARRYSWQCLTGATAEDDDDGNDMSGVGSASAAQAVGKAKVAALKEKMAQVKPQEPEPEANAEPAVLFSVLTWRDTENTANDVYEISGHAEVMQAHAELLLMHGKKVVTGKGDTRKAVVHMHPEKLSDFIFAFEQRGGTVKALKPNA